MDLVPPGGCSLSGTYFVPKDIVEAAYDSSTSYFQYAITVFDAFIDPKIAILCNWEDYHNDDLDDGHVRASLPVDAMAVFNGTIFASLFNAVDFICNVISTAHCKSVARHKFKVPLGDGALRMKLMQCINKHLNDLREVKVEGPSEARYAEYQVAMNRRVLWHKKQCL